MKSLIYGYGVTGKSFERYLKKKKVAYDIFDHNIPEYSTKLDLNNYKNILLVQMNLIICNHQTMF